MVVSANRKMSLGEIRRKINAGALTEADLRRLFRIDESKTRAFAPAVAFNKDAVDFTGFPAKPGEAADLLEAARQKQAAKTAKAAKTALAPSVKKVKLLAEGDSWFNLPWLLWPKTAMDFMEDSHDVNNLAHWGDELADMVKDGQYKGSLGSGKYRHFFLSGGGNDVLGRIGAFVSPRKAGDDNPANAPGYVKPGFGTAVTKLMKSFAAVSAALPAASVLYVHGYAHAISAPNGKYLGKPLAKLGFDPVAQAALSRAVIAHMVDIFNAQLSAFAASHSRVVYVDLRGTVGAADWNTDEIHPSAKGSKKVAAMFRAAILANTPVA